MSPRSLHRNWRVRERWESTGEGLNLEGSHCQEFRRITSSILVLAKINGRKFEFSIL